MARESSVEVDDELAHLFLGRKISRHEQHCAQLNSWMTHGFRVLAQVRSHGRPRVGDVLRFATFLQHFECSLLAPRKMFGSCLHFKISYVNSKGQGQRIYIIHHISIVVNYYYREDHFSRCYARNLHSLFASCGPRFDPYPRSFGNNKTPFTRVFYYFSILLRG